MDYFLAAAAVASLVTCAIHTVLGGREIAGPLLGAKDLRRIPKLTMYYCWHMVTIILFAMGLAYGYAAAVPGNLVLAVATTALAVAFGVLSLGLALTTKGRLTHLPQWALFTVIAATATPALL